ncbi:MAG: hypothetical protein K9H16_15445 [Bacteroidales bacterium]|nr:hypothetical protein [Bacteroidales bacterium]
MNRLFVLMVMSLVFLISCGKPNTPESIEPEPEPDLSGGYKVVSRFQTPGFAQDVVKNGDLLYMAQGEGGLLIVDVSKPENPEILTQIFEDVKGYSAKIALKDSIAYLAAGTYGVTVVDASNPFVPGINQWYLAIVKPAKSFEIMGDYLFTALSGGGVQVIYIKKNIGVPDTRSNIATPGYATGITISPHDSTMFAACGEMGLAIYYLSDFDNGYANYPMVGWCDTPGYAEDVVLNYGESTAFLACGTEGLQILNYSDTANITLVGSYATKGYAKELKYEDQKIFITAGMQGVQIIDVSNVASPKIIGLVETENARGFAMDENYLYVADEVEGLIVISRPK